MNGTSDFLEPLEELETPCVLIDYRRLFANITMMQESADQWSVALRPHIKTHKSIEIARLQLQQGAVGITASKSREALEFIRAGIGSVTVAYPLVDIRKVRLLLSAARQHGVDLRLLIDSLTGIEVMARATRTLSFKLGIFVKIDVGLRRCGVVEDDSLLMELVSRVIREPYLDFRGLISHAGHAYGAKSRQEVEKIAHDEWACLNRIRNRLRAEGIDAPEVSIGSTPTVLASNRYQGITEIRPGNYVFLDRTPLRLNLVQPSQVALSVLATVVSINRDYFIIDAGSKVLSSDQGAHGSTATRGYGIAYPIDRFPQGDGMLIVKLSEEHGFVERKHMLLRIGSRVRIICNHACAVANLTDSYIVIGRRESPIQWRVDARGKVL